MMLRKALDAGATDIVFIDHDLSWKPSDLLMLIETPGDVVCGTYRFKKPEVDYMGAVLTDVDGYPAIRDDGCFKAHSAPAGFLKVTTNCINRFMEAYPELVYGDRWRPYVDLFNHGAHKGVWYGEDYAFCRNWRDAGGEIIMIPDLDISHWSSDLVEYPFNLSLYLRQQEGGDLYTGATDGDSGRFDQGSAASRR
jgi:hypothetical protein